MYIEIYKNNKLEFRYLSVVFMAVDQYGKVTLKHMPDCEHELWVQFNFPEYDTIKLVR